MEKIALTINDQWLMVKKWIRENKLELFILSLILLLGAFLRLYRISEYMTFLGDEGRDVIVVRRLLVNFDPILVGPGTSIGNMYLGPLYYYMMAPWLLVFGLSPVGPAVMIALLGVATIFLVWYVAREWFSNSLQGQSLQVGALVASGLYAISPTVITYSRSSWNPNIMPFFALLSIYSIWKMYKFDGGPREVGKWLTVLGVSYAFVLQSHYLGLLLAPPITLFWFLTFLKIKKLVSSLPVGKAGAYSLLPNFLKYSALSFLLFSFLMSPLVIFDARHGWRNFDAMKKFFTERQTTVSARPWNAITKIYPLFEKVNTRLLTGRNETVGKWTSIGVVSLLTLLLLFKKKQLKIHTTSYLLLATWIALALLGLGLYKQEIYDHYYGFFFPAPFLLLGAVTQYLTQNTRYLMKIILFFAFCILIFVNIQNSPLRYSPNRQLQRTEEVGRKISEEANDQNFNLAVIAERNYEDAYQYFLEWWKEPVVDIDPLRANDTITNQLFVVCELPVDICDPTHNPKAEVANFGWSKVEGEWQVSGVTLYKLVHTQ